MHFDFLSAIFFPRVCIPCGRSVRRGALCDACRKTIAVSSELTRAIGSAYLIGAAASYENSAVKTLIQSLKFRRIRTAAEPLAEIMADCFSNLHGFSVIPIPLSRERLRVRGFNQSELIAQSFADRTGSILERSALIRTRHAKPQSETKTIAERKENIRGVFTVHEPSRVTRKNIILIDDVTTSGATFLEAAKVLRTARARDIIALAAARA